MGRDSLSGIAEQEVEAAVAHYADWEGFPRFVLPEQEWHPCTHYFMNLLVRRLAERAARLLGAGHKGLVDRVCDGGRPDSLAETLSVASEIVEAAIAKVPYESEFTLGNLPSNCLSSPVEFVREASSTFTWACGYAELDRSRLQQLCSALCIWAICWAKVRADESVHAAEDLLSEAWEFLSIAERCDAIRVHNVWGAERALTSRYALRNRVKQEAHKRIYCTRVRRERQKITAQRVVDWVNSIPEHAHIERGARGEKTELLEVSFDTAMTWIKEWRAKEK